MASNIRHRTENEGLLKDAAVPWRRSAAHLERTHLWTDTYSLTDKGERSCLERTVKYTFSDAEIILWRDKILGQIDAGMMDDVCIIYFDRFFMEGLKHLKVAANEHPLLALFYATKKRRQDARHPEPEPDGLLETGCALDEEELELLKDYVNIVTMGWTYYHRRYPKLSKLTHAEAWAPPKSEDKFFEQEEHEIDKFVANLSNSHERLPEQVDILIQVAEEISKNKNHRHWCVLTLRHLGALCVDINLARNTGELCWWLLRVPHFITIPHYFAQAGDVFRGAFGAAFCKSKNAGSTAKRLQYCTREAVWVANKRTAFFSPDDFFEILQNSRAAPRVLVVGSGVIGLTTAITLLKTGYDVVVLAVKDEENGSEKQADVIPSYGAASFWMPFKMAGKLTAAQSDCAIRTYKKWKELEEEKTCPKRSLTHGICTRLRCGRQTLVDEWDESLIKYLEIAADLTEDIKETENSARSSSDEDDVPPTGSIHFRTYIIESRQYMWELHRQLIKYGGVKGLLTQRLDVGDGHATLRSLAHEYPDFFIVNCTGGSGTRLSRDNANMELIRGDLLHYKAKKLPDELALPHVVIDESKDETLAYVIRHTDTFVLGGTAIDEQDMKYLTQEEVQKIPEKIQHNCINFLTPQWANVIRGLNTAPNNSSDDQFIRHTVAHRPRRDTGPRVEREGDSNIFHNYGHAGSGWSMCWGSAEDIVNLVQQAARQ